ncbi:MAG: ATP-binding cassette domain-containing protein [Lachnospiraceae bacterium]|nr:ATP-binding cassette domain-containing protein [Lachnospiraceae bacterium]
MDDRKKILSVKDLEVKFHVRGRVLTAIRGISLDIYENESIAIVGESGSGKSVFTKTFAGMLDSNGFIPNGDIYFDDEELSDTWVKLDSGVQSKIEQLAGQLDSFGNLTSGAEIWKQMQELEQEKTQRATLSAEQKAEFDRQMNDLVYRRTEESNLKQTFDPKKEKDQIRQSTERIKAFDAEIKALEQKKAQTIKEHKAAVEKDTAYLADFNQKMSALKSQYSAETSKPISEEQKDLNRVIAKEIVLSASRYPRRRYRRITGDLLKACRAAMERGDDLSDTSVRSATFDKHVLYVKYLEETEGKLHGSCVLNLARSVSAEDWTHIRGTRIATVFQDPMTSLNPVITIGKQISSVIMKHQGCSEAEARQRAIDLMYKVGIPNAADRYDDYPFQYSGGMRQRIVIAIALSCQPRILICDEPTTALDVTIQAQILQLLKDLQKEYHYTIVFITHDLGVVANIADRVAVLYAGQIIELGNVEEVFYDPQHPYTWALLSALPQFAEKGVKLYSITGTPPSLYNKIVGDAFAPRNPYCMKIDTLEEPPLFQVTETHFAKTWLLDPRSPKVEKPEIIRDIHGKLMKTYHLDGV